MLTRTTVTKATFELHTRTAKWQDVSKGKQVLRKWLISKAFPLLQWVQYNSLYFSIGQQVLSLRAILHFKAQPSESISSLWGISMDQYISVLPGRKEISKLFNWETEYKNLFWSGCLSCFPTLSTPDVDTPSPLVHINSFNTISFSSPLEWVSHPNVIPSTLFPFLVMGNQNEPFPL